MSPEATTVGTCPECGTVLQSAQVLIEYEKSDRKAIYADCYSCGAVVHPE